LVGLNYFTLPRAIVDLHCDPGDIIPIGGLAANAAIELCNIWNSGGCLFAHGEYCHIGFLWETSRSEAKANQERIEAVAADINNLPDAAADGEISYSQVEECLSILHALGKFPPNSVVFPVAQAFGSKV
jgi:hypothetical protein